MGLPRPEHRPRMYGFPILAWEKPIGVWRNPGQRGGWLDFLGNTADVLGVPSIGDVVVANVRAERARVRMTQRQLAERLGWSVGTLADLEAGRRRPAVDDLPRLCAALNVTLVDLLARADPDDLRRLGLGG